MSQLTCGIGTITPGRLLFCSHRKSARIALIDPEAPAESIIFCQSAGKPSRRSIYCATCCRITSIPAESEYEPTDPPLQPFKIVLARSLQSSGIEGSLKRGSYVIRPRTCRKIYWK